MHSGFCRPPHVHTKVMSHEMEPKWKKKKKVKKKKTKNNKRHMWILIAHRIGFGLSAHRRAHAQQRHQKRSGATGIKEVHTLECRMPHAKRKWIEWTLKHKLFKECPPGERFFKWFESLADLSPIPAIGSLRFSSRSALFGVHSLSVHIVYSYAVSFMWPSFLRTPRHFLVRVRTELQVLFYFIFFFWFFFSFCLPSTTRTKILRAKITTWKMVTVAEEASQRECRSRPLYTK